jgi:hypothetical protein
MSARRGLETDWLVSNRCHTIVIILSGATITSHSQTWVALPIPCSLFVAENRAFVTTALGLQRNPSRLALDMKPRAWSLGPGLSAPMGAAGRRDIAHPAISATCPRCHTILSRTAVAPAELVALLAISVLYVLFRRYW